MEISQTLPAVSAALPSKLITPADVTSDFDTFLKMLTVQLQNQDPLNPIESSDYAVQLATFSGVEQQVQTNDLLRNLTGQMGASGLSDLAGWVGKEVRVARASHFDGTPVKLSPQVASGSTSAELAVSDANGFEVQRLPVDLLADFVEWPGIAVDGSYFPTGNYRFDIISYKGDTVLSEAPVTVYTLVTEVRLDEDGAKLVLQSGESVLASEVTALRAQQVD